MTAALIGIGAFIVYIVVVTLLCLGVAYVTRPTPAFDQDSK